jgi:hypothetical protein
MRWVGHVARIGERKNSWSISDGKSEGKRPFGGPRHRWEDNTGMDLREMGCEGMEWMKLAHNRDQRQSLVDTVTNLRVP